MTLGDAIALALRNLSQARLRTALTMLGVSIGIASLTGMVSFGVGLQDQLVGRFTQSGLFDSITVTAAPAGGRPGGAGARGRGRGAMAPPVADDDTPPRRRLDDEAVDALARLPHVAAVYPTLRVPVQVTFGDRTEGTAAAAVPMAVRNEGAFQNILHGAFFASDTSDDCLLSLDMARRLSDRPPQDLVGRSLVLGYAARVPAGKAAQPGALQIRRVDAACRIAGIVERETGPMLAGATGVSALMIPMGRARAIAAEQVTSAQSLLGPMADDRAYPSVTVKVDGVRHTQDVQAEIRRLGYGAFSLNDLLQGAKRAFLVLDIDIVLALIGSIALAVSSLGIVNTMVMSILERTREIGVMKAIGAGDGDIRRIFLIEAAIIGVGGGAAGVGLGWVVGRAINFGANIYIEQQGGTAGNLFSLPLWLVAGAIGFSVLVSLAAGSYPARRAARLDPIQALRHD